MGAAFVPRTKKVPVKNRHVPDHRRTLATVAAGLLLVATTLLTGATPAAAAPPATVTGQACLPGQGVTVAVDFAPDSDEVVIGCAIGTQTTMAAAGAGAGFTFAPTTGFLATINGVAPADPAVGFWSIFINTTDGEPAGPLGPNLTSSMKGIDGGPLAVDTVLLFDLVEDFNVTEDPRITLQELGETAPDSGAVQPPSYSPTGDGDALAAAGWIGRQLEASGGVLKPAGTADYGLTMDAIFALAAAGVGGSDIKLAANALYESGTGYLGAASDAAANAGKIAKTTLALQVAGLDPTVFPDGAGGTRNLPAELRLAMLPDGAFGPNDFPLVHSLAMLALRRTAGGVPAPAVNWLQAAQCTTPGDSF